MTGPQQTTRAPSRFTGRDRQLMARTLADIDRQNRAYGFSPVDRYTADTADRMVAHTSLHDRVLRPAERAEVADLITEHVGAATGPAVW